MGALVKQDKDAAVLARLLTPEKINMAAAHVFLDALFMQCCGRTYQMITVEEGKWRLLYTSVAWTHWLSNNDGCLE